MKLLMRENDQKFLHPFDWAEREVFMWVRLSVTGVWCMNIALPHFMLKLKEVDTISAL